MACSVTILSQIEKIDNGTTSEMLPLLRNSMGFVGGAVGAYLIAQSTVGRRLEKGSES